MITAKNIKIRETIKPVAYLAHSNNERKFGKEVQAYLESLGFEVLNPFDHGEDEAEWLDNTVVWKDNILDIQSASTEIVKKDIALIDRSDVVIALYPYNNITVGIDMEIYHAYENTGIPIHLAISPPLSKHPWLVACASEIYTDKELLYAGLKKLYFKLAGEKVYKFELYVTENEYGFWADDAIIPSEVLEAYGETYEEALLSWIEWVVKNKIELIKYESS